MSNEAQVRIRRSKSFADRLRTYRVELDGLPVASLRAGDLITLPVMSGRHSLSLKIDWCGSEEVQFDAVAGECVEFECGSALTGWRFLLGLFYVCFRPRKYLFLQKTV
jgi:hypothetical protein